MTAPNDSLPGPPGVSPTVVSSIGQASRATSIDFAMLMAQAKAESGFRVDAKASSGSSAIGLFQFINSTWLSLVQRFGEQATVADPALRERIPGLRKDASLSATLAAEYARANKGEIERAFGRPAGNAELCLAHFLGPARATALLKAVTQNGDALGAALLPGAAAANRAVFFDAAGRARSVGEIYRSFAQRIDIEVQRFSTAHAGTSAAAAADVLCFVSHLGFHGEQLSQPMIAMLNAFALSALQLLASPKPAGPSGPSRRAI